MVLMERAIHVLQWDIQKRILLWNSINSKVSLSSDLILKLELVKKDSVVILNKNVKVNNAILFVQIARHSERFWEYPKYLINLSFFLNKNIIY